MHPCGRPTQQPAWPGTAFKHGTARPCEVEVMVDGTRIFMNNSSNYSSHYRWNYCDNGTIVDSVERNYI